MKQLALESEQRWLYDLLQDLWGLYFNEINIVGELLKMVKDGHSQYSEEVRKQAETVTEDSFKNVKSQFPADVLLRYYQIRVSYVEEFPKLMRQLTLIRAVSCFEFYVNNSIGLVLRIYPGLIQENFRRKPDPLKSQMGFLKSIENKLEFLRGSKGGGFGFDLTDRDFTEEQLREIHETRHILVHNMGYVDNKYIGNVGSTELKENEERPLSDQYITASFNALNNFTMFLKPRIEKKFCGIIKDD